VTQLAVSKKLRLSAAQIQEFWFRFIAKAVVILELQEGHLLIAEGAYY
jgi:hypothetical protein